MPLVQEQHRPQVAHPLIREAWAGDELQTLQLPKVGGVAQHVDVQQLRDVPTSVIVKDVLEQRSHFAMFRYLFVIEHL